MNAVSLPVTVWPKLNAEVPGEVVEMPWPELVTRLSEPTKFRGKWEQPGWSPGRFDPPLRSLENLREIFAVGLDFDEGTTPIADALAFWEGTAGVLHTTKRHAFEAPRYRVILRTSRMIDADEYRRIWTFMSEVAAADGQAVDVNAKDPSRLWYQPGTLEEGGPFECHELHGDPLDVDRVLAEQEIREQANKRSSSTERTGPEEPTPRLRRRAAAYLEKMPPGISGQGGHRATWRAALVLTRGFALPEDAALELLAERFNPRCDPPWSPGDLEHKIRDAATRSQVPLGFLLDGHDADDPALSGDERPVIRISTELHRNVDDAITALRRDPSLYQRAGELVQIVRHAEPDGEVTPGTPVIHRVPPAQINERLTRVARFEKFDGRSGDFVRRLPTGDIVRAVASRGMWPGIRPLVSVVEVPTLRPDGTVLQQPGYDSSTGLLFEPGDTFPPVADVPSQAEAKAALDRLLEPWIDFPFSNDVERHVQVAAVLTMLARHAIRGSVPAFVVDKSTRGSGGTLITDAVAITATGREAAKMSWSADEAEQEKVLGSYAINGAPLITFDNLSPSAVFGGGPLDRVLTATDTVELRVLGRSEVPRLRWRAMIQASGNNVQLGPDTTRRVLLVRLEPDVERPEERTGFRHPDLLGWLRRERPRLVHDGLTILRAYAAAGRPDVGLPQWGSFEAWRGLVASAIVFAGGPDVLACRATGAGSVDPELGALRAILEHWPRLAPDGLSAKRAIECLYSRDYLMGQSPPDGFNVLRDAIEALVPTAPGRPPSSRKLGYRLRSFKGRVVGGRKIDVVGGRSGIVRWGVISLEHHGASQPSPPKEARGGWDGGDEGDDSNPSRGNCQTVGGGDTFIGGGTDHPHDPHHPNHEGLEAWDL